MRVATIMLFAVLLWFANEAECVEKCPGVCQKGYHNTVQVYDTDEKKYTPFISSGLYCEVGNEETIRT